MTDHVKKAAQHLRNIYEFARIGSLKLDATAEQVCEALDAAGLLVTPEMKECGEALLQLYACGLRLSGSDHERAYAAGRALAESRKPKPRWAFEWLPVGNDSGAFEAVVVDKHGEWDAKVYPTEAHARAVVKALNEVEG